ncbi:hypothetical protein [Bacillus velezensis]|uniref:hypothetical protein n=1 Tax=Bacillus velezensis TaxID=492670 RepID=UPI00052A26B7|nr:hypothetical protein [Bacillus velezensis]AIU75243.1 hypothetical protein MA22_01360 [Bacillus subtilis]WEC91485.1 hypothetical protein PT966_19270 [Bacillus velezensis]WHM13439.1 hypothetical protein QLX65_19550 [Bacillus velezensis]
MKFVLKYRSKIILAVVSVFLFSILGTTAAEAAESPNNQSLVRDTNLEKEFSSLLSSQKALYAIENIPDSVVNQGSDAILDWFRNNINDQSLINDMNAAATELHQSDKPFKTQGVLGCISAVGTALASLAFAPAKLLKIKKAIKALGGVKTFVTKTYQYYNYYKKKYRSKKTAWNKAVSKAASKASPEIKEAIMDFFGITAIVSACIE